MNDPATYSIAGRLAMAAVVVIGPTLLFLGLVRGLEKLRDDAFLLRWAHHPDNDPEDLTNDDVLAVLATGAGIDADESTIDRCPACGTRNRSGMTYCRECLKRVQ